MGDTREHIHIQNSPYRFSVSTYAPITETDKMTGKKTCGKGRFTIETMVYVTGVGWDVFDMANADNELLLGLYQYVKLYEDVLGYKHEGNSSTQIKNLLENLWGKKID